MVSVRRLSLWRFSHGSLCALGALSGSASGQFLEDVHVLDEIDALQEFSTFGYEVRTVEDTDGDGVQDFLVGAPQYDGVLPGIGRIDCYSGATRELLWSTDADRRTSIFGYEIEPIPDVNGDGVEDVAAGAPFANGGAFVWILSGADGTPLHRIDEPEAEEFGSAITCGDVDGDGDLELLVGAPGFDDDAENMGRVRVYSLDGFGLETTIEHPSADLFLFGKMLTVIGDVNDDGAEEFVALAAVGSDSVFFAEAFVFTWNGSGFDVLYSIENLGLSHLLLGNAVSGGLDINGDQRPDWVIHPSTTDTLTAVSGFDGQILIDDFHTNMGQTVHVVPDMNGDGRADIMTGLFSHDDGADVGGKFLIVSGDDGSVLHEITHTIEGARFAMGHDLIEDISGDGIPDLVVGAEGGLFNGNGPLGKIWIIEGPDLAPGCPADLDGDGDADAEDFFAYLDAFASGVSGVCDIDGDGDCDAEDFFGYLDLFTEPC